MCPQFERYIQQVVSVWLECVVYGHNLKGIYSRGKVLAAFQWVVYGNNFKETNPYI